MSGGGEQTEEEPKRVRPSARERDLLQSPSSLEADDPAAAEARQLSSGLSARDLKRESEESDHDRSEKFRNHFENAIIVMMWVVVFGFLALAAVWAINMGLPEKARWLSKDQMHDLQGVLTGGLLIGLVSEHVKKRVS